MDTHIAKTDYPVHELIKKRWSPRAFSAKKIEKEKLLSLFEAARWAASCFNEQPWAFVYAEKDQREEFERILNCLVELNQSWAKAAPVLMISVAKLNFDQNGKPNRHAFHDVGQAVSQLAIQAAALGLYIHQMAGFDPEKAKKDLKLPEGYEAVAAVAVGYLGDPKFLPEKLQEKEQEKSPRKPVQEFVFRGSWDTH